MNKMLPRRLLVAAMLAAGAVSSAQAVNFVEIDSVSLRFFYDADFWGEGVAAISGDSISFAVSDDFEVGAKSKTASGVGAAGHGDSSTLSLFAVAKTGYTVSSSITGGANTAYSFTTGSAYSGTLLAGDIKSGTYAGGVFTAGTAAGSYNNSVTKYSTGTADSANYATDIAGGNGSYFSALGLTTTLGIGVQQTGVGNVNSAINSVTYNFTVAAVPEPETYAMLIAGLGLVGFAARRRKRAA